ncbi:hypothetical protein [Streptomyces sp. WM6372]|nr:hypothetical protein [Streptomyces sp. WM6372]
MPEPSDEMDAYDRRIADLEQAPADYEPDEDGDYTITFLAIDTRKP